MTTTMYFRRPGHGDHGIHAGPSVGLTSDGDYVTQACIDPSFGDSFAVRTGRGETPAAAMSSAASAVRAAERHRYETGSF